MLVKLAPATSETQVTVFYKWNTAVTYARIGSKYGSK